MLIRLLLGVRCLWCSLIGMDIYFSTSVCVLDSLLKLLKKDLFDHGTCVGSLWAYDKNYKIVLKNDVWMSLKNFVESRVNTWILPLYNFLTCPLAKFTICLISELTTNTRFEMMKKKISVLHIKLNMILIKPNLEPAHGRFRKNGICLSSFRLYWT